MDLKDRNVYLSFVKRSVNKLAHYLTRYNYSIADFVWRMDNAHLNYLDVMLKDLMN